MFRRLRRSAPYDEDAAIVAKRFTWPKEMCFGAPALTIPGSRVAFQVVEPERVRMLLVKVPDPHANGSAGDLVAERCHCCANR